MPNANSPAGLRILVDESTPDSGWSEWGIDRMSEGESVYRYPQGERVWKWESEGRVVFAVRSNAMAIVLPNVEARGTFRWIAEWYDDQWRVIRRHPSQGILTNDAAALPPPPPWLEPPMPDIRELLQFAPESLSRRLQREYLDHEWHAMASLPALPHLTLPGCHTLAELALAWTDARTGLTQALLPQSAETDGARIRWHGKTPNGDSWFLVVDALTESSVDVTAWIQSTRERALRLSLGIRYPEGAWTWFDDVQHAEPMEAGRCYAFAGPSPYGLAQRRSFYPFGVIASDNTVLVAETDGREPRHIYIQAVADERTLWIHYDLAVTPLTRYFPGIAAVRARFRAEPRSEIQPFRAALQAWYARDPAWWTARTPRHGLWMPFTDIGTLSNAADFGFAFFEKVGPHGTDLDNARAVGALNLIYTEPWLYWLPLANTSDWNSAAAVRRMEELARKAFGQDRAFASAALLGVTRDMEQQPRIQFLVTPWNTGARMEIITDPELPVTSNAPVNCAMAEWQFIRESLEDSRVDGVYLDSMSEMQTIDYNPNALAVADHPATYVMADLKPGVATPIQAVEFVAALSGYLRSRGLFLMGNYPCWRFPFFVPYLDILGEETCWYTGTQYMPMSARELNYRRAMSGARPFGFLQAARFNELSASDVEKYFRDCLALGLLPSFFSHDGANDPYWENAALYERDRPLFRRYVPLIICLSEAGWVPVADVFFSEPSVQVEQFGAATGGVFWVTLRNTTGRVVSGTLRARSNAADRIAYAVDSGHVYPALADAPELKLAPGAVAVWALMTHEALPSEIAWFRRYARHSTQYHAAAVNLASFAREQELGLAADIEARTCARPDKSFLPVLVLQNRADRPLQFAGFEGGSTNVGTTRVLSPGERVEIEIPGVLDMSEGQWARVHWRIRADEQSYVFKRIVLPAALPDLLFDGPDGRFIAHADEAQLLFAVTNRGLRERSVTLHATGDLPGERHQWNLQPGSATQVAVRVASHGARVRRLVARWELEGQTEREHEVFVIFAPKLNHLAMKPGVRVIADSVYPGYMTAPLQDGVVETTGLAWYDAAFATAETTEPHWIRVLFPAPERVSSVTAHWNLEDSILYASHQGEVWGLLPDGSEVKLGAFRSESEVPYTRVEFEPTLVRAVEWRQPPSGGSAARPNLLWLVELEVR